MAVQPQIRPVQRVFELIEQLESLGDTYVHRGQSDNEWPLQTSIERACPPENRQAAERSLLAAFKSRTHHYNVAAPSEQDDLEWLALMQHFGAPTRLLDWTRSPYVAAYFGAENATRGNPYFSVWSVDVMKLKRSGLGIVNRIATRFVIDPLLLPEDTRFGEPAVFGNYLLSSRYEFVAPVQARRMNERLTTQQGLFLCMGKLERSFEDNLGAALSGVSDTALLRTDVPVTCREELLNTLDKMNINRATLFPGLDGFAQHLRTRITMDGGRGSAVLSEFGFL
jgi:hypothetical protein